ncbi:MAG: hypothetical protein AAF251_07575 [Pseudomonadota bacterium]
MSWATAIFLMVLIWGAVTVWSRRHDRELGVTRDEDGNPVFAPQTKIDTSAQDAEIAELKERIAVLERIATDHNSMDARERARIASEIEALRSPETTPLPDELSNPTSTPSSTDA